MNVFINNLIHELLYLPTNPHYIFIPQLIFAKKCTPGGSNSFKTLVYGNIKHTKEKGANCPSL
jgi:hypothetical protein